MYLFLSTTDTFWEVKAPVQRFVNASFRSTASYKKTDALRTFREMEDEV